MSDLNLYTTQDHQKCRVCDRPASHAQPLVKVNGGWKCTNGQCKKQKAT